MKEKTCSICFNCESTYPLDPPGSLYCDVVEDYVSANGSCGSFKENAIQQTTEVDGEKLATEIHEACQSGASVSDIIQILSRDGEEPHAEKVLTESVTQPKIDFCHACGTALGCR